MICQEKFLCPNLGHRKLPITDYWSQLLGIIYTWTGTVPAINWILSRLRYEIFCVQMRNSLWSNSLGNNYGHSVQSLLQGNIREKWILAKCLLWVTRYMPNDMFWKFPTCENKGNITLWTSIWSICPFSKSCSLHIILSSKCLLMFLKWRKDV